MPCVVTNGQGIIRVSLLEGGLNRMFMKVPWMLLAEAAEEPVSGLFSSLSTLLVFVLMGGVLYFMMIRPQRKKDKQVKKMLAELKVGDRVTTIGGIHGTVVSIKDDTLVVTVGQDKIKLVFARWAIRNVDEVSIANDAETLV